MTRHLRLLFSLASLVIGLAGCQRAKGFAMAFSPCEALMLVPPPNTPEAKLAGMQQAIAMWRAVASVELSLGEAGAEASSARLPIRFVETALYMGRFADEEGAILLSTAVTDPDVLAVVLAHELGHAFGLHHVDEDERASVMNEGNRHIAPTPADAATLADAWGACVTGQSVEQMPQ